MEQRLQIAEAQLAQAVQTINALVEQFLPAALGRIEALEGEVAALKASGSGCACTGKAAVAPAQPKTRTPTDYGTYLQIMSLIKEGYSEAQVATQVGVHYNTVRSYMKWDEARIEKKKLEWEKKQAALSKAEAVPPAPEPAVTPPPAESEIVDAEYTPVGTFAESGWMEWTEDSRAYYAQHYDEATGVAGWLPTNAGTYVLTMYAGNACSLPKPVEAHYWGGTAENNRVLRWRFANEVEIAQHKPL